tara:strand:+ start:28774 stop:30300 length:1527 start_codon:yes stop_codon:yes gene_type:complete
MTRPWFSVNRSKTSADTWIDRTCVDANRDRGDLVRPHSMMIRPIELADVLPRLGRWPGSWLGSSLFGVACILLLGGCTSTRPTLATARQSFAVGDVSAARETLITLAEKNDRYADAAELDLALVELSASDARAAEQRLRKLRDRFDAQPDISPLREAASIISDDTARAFRPAGYEQVMIRAMLAVCSLAGDGTDAEAYTLQATMKQNELAEDASERGIANVSELYQPIAVAPYLRGILREATHHDFDDAGRAYQLVSSLQPGFVPAAADIARASGGAHSAPGHGVLYVLACVGRGPVLQETTAPTTTAALQIASALLNVETNDDSNNGRSDRNNRAIALGNIASVKVPKVTIPASEISAVGVHIDGELFGATQTLTDVGRLAIDQSDAEMPWTIARAVLRRVTKETAVAKARDSLGLTGTAGSLFHFAAASAWSSTEKADTRCWGMLPREVQVLRAELPCGRYQIQLQPLGFSGQTIAAGEQRSVEITDATNHYLIVMAPDRVLYVSP